MAIASSVSSRRVVDVVAGFIYLVADALAPCMIGFQ